jgi:hypothetical protein
MKFIELTDWRDNLIIVNASSIQCMREEEGITIITFIGDSHPLKVLNSPAKIIDKIDDFTEDLI